MNGRDLQFALSQETKSHLPLVASLAARRPTALRWIVAACITLILAEASLGASNSASPSAGTPDLATDATEVQVLGVRSSTEADYSWVVIDLSADVRYKVGHLSHPERLYLDLSRTRISSQLASRRITLNDAFVGQIRMGTDQGDVTRIVLDLHSVVRSRVSKLGSPARLLVELSRPADATEPEGGVAKWSDVRDVAGQVPAGVGPTQSGPSGETLRAKDESSLSSNSENSRAKSASGPHTYGDGEKAGLNYAGTSPPRNILALGLNVGSSYDDNILGNNQQPVGDAAFQFGPSLHVRREGQRLNLGLSYEPHFRIYRRASELNGVDQTFGFDAAYRASSRLSFRGRTSAFYTTGIFQPNRSGEFLPGLGSPSSLNDTVFTPTARQLTWSSRIDASYQVAAHDSVNLFVGQSRLDFRQQISNSSSLQNTEQKDAGLVYQHRLSPHTTLGMDYQYVDIRFGPDSRTLVHSAFFSYAQQVSPSLSLSVFGGPQFSHLHEVIALPLGPFTFRIPVSLATSNWALGGTLTKQLDKTAFQLTAQHQVSDGGGLLGAVVSSSVAGSLRRRLPGRWDASWSAAYADNRNLDTTHSRGAYQSLTAGTGFQRSLTEKLSVRLGFDFIHQRGSGQSQLFGDFDRDLWSVQFSYRFHEIALGR
jgi:AMIN domain-containing protein